MAVATFGNKTALLQEHYGNVHDVLQRATEVINRLPTSNKKPEGLQFRELIKLSYPAGFGYYGPKMTRVPDPQTGSQEEAIMHMAYGYGQIGIDWVLMSHNAGTHSYLNALSAEMKDFTVQQAEMNEMWATADGTGRLGHDYSGVLDSAHMRGRIDRQSNDSAGRLVVRMYGSANHVWFKDGMMVEFMYDSVNDGVHAGTTADPSDFNTWDKRDTPANGYYTVRSVTVSKSVTASSDYIDITFEEPPVGAGNDPGETETTRYDVIVADESVAVDASIGALNLTNVPYGLDVLISDTNALMQMHTPTNGLRLADASMHGIDAAKSQWQSAVADGGGGYFGLAAASEMGSEIARKSNSGPEGIKFVLMDYFQAEKFALSLEEKKRYPNTGSVGKMGNGNQSMFSTTKGVDVADKEVLKSRFALRDRAIGCGKGVRQYTLEKFSWVDVGGGVWQRDPSGAPRNIATAKGYTNLGITDRTASGKITNLKTR